MSLRDLGCPRRFRRVILRPMVPNVNIDSRNGGLILRFSFAEILICGYYPKPQNHSLG